MIGEKDLTVGAKYLYFSASKMCEVNVTFVGKRTYGKINYFIFRDPKTLNEVWCENLINIAIDQN